MGGYLTYINRKKRKSHCKEVVLIQYLVTSAWKTRQEQARYSNLVRFGSVIAESGLSSSVSVSLLRLTELPTDVPALPLVVDMTPLEAPAVVVVDGSVPADVAVLGVWCSSLRKLGPEPTTGVAKFSGLGSVLLSLPRKFHSG